MATVINGVDLVEGDVFFLPRNIPINRAGILSVGLRRVREIRTAVYAGGTYRHIDYDVLDTIATGNLDLRVDVVVCKVEPIDPIDLVQKMTELVDSDVMTVWAAEGRLWI